MAISDNQKIDYLFKKLGYGATKQIPMLIS